MVLFHGRERLPSIAIERHHQTTAPIRRRSELRPHTATVAIPSGRPMGRRVLILLRNAATPRPLGPIRLHRALTRRRAGVTPPQAAATAAAEVAAATMVVAVVTMAVEVATVVAEAAAALMAAAEGVAALMVVVAEAVRLPTLITRFLTSTKGPFLSSGMGLFYCPVTKSGLPQQLFDPMRV